MPTTAYWCEWALLPEGPASAVLVHTDGGRITEVTASASPPEYAERLPGLTLPGMANAHSHAFHRTLRGNTGDRRGTFWTWRERMYRVAERLDPDSYYRLARAVYAEMVAAGFTSVGEFHYLHHDTDGTGYRDPNAMSAALAQAATEAGIRLTLLDTCYLSGGFGAPVQGVQNRFSDGDAEGWARRVDDCDIESDLVRLGTAVHSVRAVPPPALELVRDFAHTRGMPLHLHLSEQRAENDGCLSAYGRTPTQLLDEHGVLRAGTTAVHATHPAAGDVVRLGRSGTGICLCPTTEADLADGIGPADELAAAGCPLSLGSDGHSVIDPFAEARAVESWMRLRSEVRGHFADSELTTMVTSAGQRSLGWPDAGSIEIGGLADFVTVAMDGPRLAGVAPSAVPWMASPADVHHVVVDGKVVLRDGAHRRVPDAATVMRSEIAWLLEE